LRCNTNELRPTIQAGLKRLASSSMERNLLDLGGARLEWKDCTMRFARQECYRAMIFQLQQAV
jgi:hypothetical protein